MGTVSAAEHFGHFKPLPAAESGAFSLLPQVGQQTGIDMVEHRESMIVRGRARLRRVFLLAGIEL
jgi:hypothetical protein